MKKVIDLLQLIDIEKTSLDKVKSCNAFFTESTKYILTTSASEEPKDEIKQEIRQIINKYQTSLPSNFQRSFPKTAIDLINTCREKFDSNKAKFRQTSETNPLTTLKILYSNEDSIRAEFLPQLSEDFAITIDDNSIQEIESGMNAISKTIQRFITKQVLADENKKQEFLDVEKRFREQRIQGLKDCLSQTESEKIILSPSLDFTGVTKIGIVTFFDENNKIDIQGLTFDTFIDGLEGVNLDNTIAGIDELFGKENPLGFLVQYGDLLALMMEKTLGAAGENEYVHDIEGLHLLLSDLIRPDKQDKLSAPIYLDLENNTVRFNFLPESEDDPKPDKYAMIAAYLCFPKDRYKQLAYYAQIKYCLEEKFFFYDEVKIKATVINQFKDTLLDVAKFELLDQLSQDASPSLTKAIDDITQAFQGLKNDHGDILNEKIDPQIEKFRSLKINLDTISKGNVTERIFNQECDKHGLIKFIEKYSTSDIVIPELQSAQFKDLTQDHEKLGLSIMDSSIGITVLPIQGYHEDGKVLGQPHVGGCQLYPIFSSGIAAALELIEDDNQQINKVECEMQFSIFFNWIRGKLLGKDQRKLLNFLEGYGVTCISDNKNLDLHGEGDAALFKIDPGNTKSKVISNQIGAHNYGVVIPLSDFFNFIKKEFAAELNRFPYVTTKIDSALEKLTVNIQNDTLQEINTNIKEINTKIQTKISNHIPMSLDEEQIDVIKDRVYKIKEQNDTAKALLDSEKYARNLQHAGEQDTDIPTGVDTAESDTVHNPDVAGPSGRVDDSIDDLTEDDVVLQEDINRILERVIIQDETLNGPVVEDIDPEIDANDQPPLARNPRRSSISSVVSHVSDDSDGQREVVGPGKISHIHVAPPGNFTKQTSGGSVKPNKSYKGILIAGTFAIACDAALLAVALTKFADWAKTELGVAVLALSCVAIPMMCLAISTIIDYCRNKPPTQSDCVVVQSHGSQIGI